MCVCSGNKIKSRNCHLRSSQRSVIGPLLFLLMLGDIDKDVSHSYVSSFADDTRVLGRISGVQDVTSVQMDLEEIYQWSNINNAEFNCDKFECLRYGYDQEIKDKTAYISSIGTIIEAKDCVRDLGVQMSSNADFSYHITTISLSAQLKCAWILRAFQTRSRILMLSLWKSLVLPILDYCCQLWSPTPPGQIQALEKVQWSFISKIVGMSNLSYWQQLNYLHIYSLQRRRERYIIIYMWKILESLTPNFGIQVYDSVRRGRCCLVPHIRTSAPGRVQTLRFTSLAVLGPRLFNTIPTQLRNMTGCSIDTFKSALDKHLSVIPDQPRMKDLVRYCVRSSNSLTGMTSPQLLINMLLNINM